MAASREDMLRALDASFGSWRDLECDGAEYVERMRRGLGQRLCRVLAVCLGLKAPYGP